MQNEEIARTTLNYQIYQNKHQHVLVGFVLCEILTTQDRDRYYYGVDDIFRPLKSRHQNT